MKRSAHRLLLAAAASLFAAAGGAHAAGQGELLDADLPQARASAAQSVLTRQEVRADLVDARSAGLLDRNGEAGPTEQALNARVLQQATDARVAAARETLAERPAAGMPDLASYVEEGPDGPQLVLLMFDAAGRLYSSDTMSIAAID